MQDLVIEKQQSGAAGKDVPVGFKLTEVGIIPEDWKVVPFFDVVSIASGQISPICEPYSSMILIAPDHIEAGTGKLISKQSAKEQNAISGKYVFHSGDTIYSKIRPYLKKAIYANFDGLCSADMYPLRPKEGIEPKYILPLVLGNRFSKYAESVSARSGIPKINRTEIADFLFIIPSQREEQTAIANVLFDIEVLIADLDQLLAKKRAIKTAVMQQFLTGKTRLPQFALREDGTVKGYKNTELGEIPEDWNISTYGQVFSFLSTSTNARSNLSDTGEYGYIHYGDIHTKWDNILNLESNNLPRISGDLVSSSLIEDGDIIMADASEDYAGIGKSIEIQNTRENKIVSGLHTYLLRDMNNIFADGFRGYLHTIPAVKTNIDRLATGMKVFGISKNNLQTIPIPVPPKEEQTAIAAILSDMDKEIQVLQQRLEKTSQLKQGMMQELLTGKTRLI
ncbi:restriction endonuclease subunit S [Lonsdalea populi]